MDIDMLVEDFAWAMHEVDSFRPQARSQRVAGRQYQPGVGPFSEPEAVSLTVDMMQRVLEGYSELRPMRYPRSRNTCDLVWGDPPGWAIEVKLARVRRDNGTDEPAAVKKILSPYLADASAVTDAWRLSASEFACRKAILIYGFDDPERPLEDLIRAFEAVARLYVRLGLRSEGDLGDLVHPVFRSGRVFAWEVEPT